MEIIRKILGLHRRSKRITKKDSITGRNNSFPVPYLARLEGGELQPGHSVIVRGVIIGRQGFTINLTNGPQVEFDEETKTLNDRLLCLRIDVEHRKIHLNACINEEWGKEGTVKHKWAPGDEFDIRVRCHEEEFEVFVDHKLVARFAHYVPLTKVSHIYVNGDVELFCSSWEGLYYNVPYAADIPGSFFPGRKFCISALAKKKAKEFFVDFCAENDIAFRLNPRFSSKKIACNTRTGDEWSREEFLNLEPFPFKRKRNFDLLIYCEESKFVVYVDDCLMGSYEHRLNPRTIEKIQISGEIVLQGVHLK